MKTMKMLNAVAVWAALVSSVAGQERAEERRVGRQGAQVEVVEGEVRVDGVAVTELSQRVSAAQLSAVTSRDFDTALDELQRVWFFSATNTPFDGQARLLLEVAAARSEVLEEAGRLEEALEATRVILPRQVPSADGSTKFAAASDSLLEAADAVRSAELWKERQAELRGVLADPQRDDLERRLREDIAVGDFHLVDAVGPRAYPVLASVALADQSSFVADVENDPLFHWIRLDERNAARQILDRWESGSLNWRQRVLRARAPRAHAVFGTEILDASFAEWSEIAARGLKDKLLYEDALVLVSAILKVQDASGALAEAIEQSLLGGDSDISSGLIDALSTDKRTGPRNFGIHRTALQSQDSDTRRWAADQLVRFENNASLIGYESDPDEYVRNRAARALVFSRGGRSFEDRVAALGVFLKDSSAGVRSQALSSAQEARLPIADTDLQRLLEDDDRQVREALAWLLHLPTAQHATILERLANDSAPGSVDAVDQLLADRVPTHGAKPYAAAISRRLRSVDWLNLDRVYTGDDRNRAKWMAALIQTGAGLELLVDVTSQPGNEAQAYRAWSDMDRMRSAAGKGGSAVLALSDNALATLMPMLARISRANYSEVIQALNGLDSPRWVAMRRVMSNEENPLDVRLDAASFAIGGGTDGFETALMQLLAHPDWAERSLTKRERKILMQIGSQLRGRGRGKFALAVAKDRSLEGSVCLPLLAEHDLRGDLGRELTVTILERWFSEGAPVFWPVERALMHLGSLPADVGPEWLERAAYRQEYAAAAVESMGLLRDPRFLPVLKDCLEAAWMTDSTRERRKLQTASARALGAYMNRDAVDVLLDGLGKAGVEEVRTTIQTALDAIRKYEEEVEYWARRNESASARESAKSELLKLLDSESSLIRREALEGLATLGDPAVLPQVIPLLTDKDQFVRKAAQAALEHMTQ